MTPDSQNPSEFFDPGSERTDFLSIVKDPGKKNKTPPQKPKENTLKTLPEQPLISVSGGPTAKNKGTPYKYAYVELLEVEAHDTPPSLQNTWNSLIDDLRHGVLPEKEEGKGEGEEDAVGNMLRQCAELPPGSPFHGFLMFFAQKYADTANAPNPEQRHEAECIVDALLNIIPELASAAGITETNPEPLTPFSSLPVQRRIKTNYTPHPVFMGMNGGVPLTEKEETWLNNLSELHLYLLESLVQTITEKNIPIEKQLVPLWELLSKIAAADKVPAHIEPGCRAAFLAVLPAWWSNDFGGYYLVKSVSQDAPFDLDTPLAIRQYSFLHALRSKGTRPAIAAGTKELITEGKQPGWAMAKITGRLVQNIVLPDQRQLPPGFTELHAKRLEDLRKDLLPYYDALLSTRSLWQVFSETIHRDVLKQAFAPEGEFFSLLEPSAQILAGTYLQSYYDLPELDKDIEAAGRRIGMSVNNNEGQEWDTEKALTETEMASLINLKGASFWQQIVDIFGVWDGGTGTVDVGWPGESFPNVIGDLETPDIRKMEGSQKIKALEQETAQWLMNNHYEQVIRFTLFLVLVARLVHEQPTHVPKIPGQIITEVTLYQPNEESRHPPVYCDGIVLPQSVSVPVNLENRRLDTILKGQSPSISVIEAKTIISLYGFHNPPRAIRKREKDQLERYLMVLKQHYPDVPVEYIYLYYITFNQTRLFRYPVKDDGIDYQHVTEIVPSVKP